MNFSKTARCLGEMGFPYWNDSISLPELLEPTSLADG